MRSTGEAFGGGYHPDGAPTGSFSSRGPAGVEARSPLFFKTAFLKNSIKDLNFLRETLADSMLPLSICLL